MSRNPHRPLLGAIAAIGVLGVLSPFCCAAALAGPAPTYTRDVAPILFQHCVNCHRAEAIAAGVPLDTYAAAKGSAAALEAAVTSRAMPPWPADPAGSVPFSNDARLSQADIDTLASWVQAGAPEGGEAGLVVEPPPQPWPNPLGRKPDAVVSLPAFTLQATGEIPYIRQLIKVPYQQDKWIVAMQVRAGNPRILHHMGITEVTLPHGMKPADLDGFSQMARKLGIADGTLATIKAQVVDPTNPDAYDMIGVYTPGTALETYPGDSAKLLKAGPDSYINFNIHYTTSGRIETDRTQLALWFASQPPKHQLFRAPAAVDTIIANGRELLSDDPGTKAEGTNVAIPPIPSYADDYELIGMTAYREAVTIFQFQPHAHMRGKDFKYLVIFPDGHEETVLTVPRYDFHWQLAYALAQPLALPAGSKLVVVAHYDNSATSYARRSKDIADPANNCGPDKVAYFRRENQSWDEMFSPLIQYAVDSAPRLPEIQAVGCLVPDSHDRWSLGTAGKPVASHAEDTSSAEVAAAGATGFGKHRYELLGEEFFNPARYVHQKVVLKGVLIGAENHGRINVTSLQPLGSSCP